MKRYKSRNPVIKETDAVIIGSFIEEKFNGSVTPKQLLEAASDASSPLHRYFEWDNNRAAEAYRLNQARSLIISVYVEADGKRPMREFLKVNLDTGPIYTSADRVAESDDLVQQVIVAAYKDLLRWKDRYGRFCEYFNINTEDGKTSINIEMKGQEDESKESEGRKRSDREGDHYTGSPP